MTPVQVRWDIAYQAPGDGDSWWLQDRSDPNRVVIEKRLKDLQSEYGRGSYGLIARLARIEILEEGQ